MCVCVTARRSVQPLDVVGLPGYERLTDAEKQVSWSSNVFRNPSPYHSSSKLFKLKYTSRSAVADKLCFSMCKLWQKDKCKKRASNISYYSTKDISKCWTFQSCTSVVTNVQITWSECKDAGPFNRYTNNDWITSVYCECNLGKLKCS